MTEKTATTPAPGWMDSEDMIHPALQVLDWDDDSTGAHGIAVKMTMGAAVSTIGVVATELSCFCGFKTGPRPTDSEAFDALVEHALTTCAVCGGRKPSVIACGPKAGEPDTFPRCSACAA